MAHFRGLVRGAVEGIGSSWLLLPFVPLHFDEELTNNIMTKSNEVGKDIWNTYQYLKTYFLLFADFFYVCCLKNYNTYIRKQKAYRHIFSTLRMMYLETEPLLFSCSAFSVQSITKAFSCA